MRFLAVPALALMALTTTADAQTALTPKTLAVLPPLEYDHPYEGRLTVTGGDKDLMGQLCPKTAFPVTLGCARRYNDSCSIVIATDEIIKAVGWTTEIVLRDEIGHCNGWPPSHVDARIVDPEKPPPSNYDREIIERLKKRNDEQRNALKTPLDRYGEGLAQALLTLGRHRLTELSN